MRPISITISGARGNCNSVEDRAPSERDSASNAASMDDHGHREELARLYRAEADFVYRTARQLGVPESQVEDVVHDVFLVAHRRLPGFRGEGSIRSWLYGITRRVVMHIHRGRARARERLQIVQEPLPQATPDSQLQVKQAMTAVEAFLATLDSDKRLIFSLVEIEGLRIAEVAQLLDVNVNTAHSRVRTARRLFERWVARQRHRDSGGPNDGG